ncbi:hypothetical protein KC220_23870, partial [Mycobacterium tuberculosis]|nr:hypothetical protein [Mycobacterium tuberculosis]
MEPAQDLVDAFEVRTTTDIAAAAAAAAGAADVASVAETASAAVAGPAPALLDAPLSAPLPAEGVIDEDSLARPQQEQVRVRAD